MDSINISQRTRDTINLLPQLKRDIANIALTKLKMKNVFSFIVPYSILALKTKI
jgi:hypothetical protein